VTGGKDAFLKLLERSSAELYADHADLMDTGRRSPLRTRSTRTTPPCSTRAVMPA
jgi:hypothetical protein